MAWSKRTIKIKKGISIPAEGQRMSLKEWVEEDLGGLKFSQKEGEATSLDALIITCLVPSTSLLKPQ
jgi:hypothetical protein